MSNAARAKYVWFDGDLIAWDDARVHLLTHSLHYGLGAFEGIRAYELEGGQTAVFRLEEHLLRLERSCKILQLDLPYSREQLTKACLRTIEANEFRACYLRPLVFLGDGSMGVLPRENPVHTAVAVWEWGAYLGPEALSRGIRVRVSSFVRQFPNSGMSKAKATGGYINSIMAKREAAALGYEEALLLDTSGFVAEGSGENFFLVREGRLITPPAEAILEGITRDAVIQLARGLGYEVIERRITRDELYIADEAFFTGTAAELTPICEIDDRTVGGGRPGPLTTALQAAFFDAVRGVSEEHRAWLTPAAGVSESVA